MKVSLGVMAYNEEKNIGNLLRALLDQRTKTAKIKEIIVVSSGSTDKTNRIVKSLSRKSKKIKLIIQKKREGKASAINKFLKAAKNEILVLESGDTIPEKNSIEKLCQPLNDKETGIVASHPVPLNTKKSFLNTIVQFQWALHHKINLQNPKFGELIAFRNLFDKIENTAVDEEYIAMRINKKGFKGIYVPEAIVHNSGPETIADLVRQRRRIYWGHLELKKKYGYKAATIRNFFVFRLLLKELNVENILPAIFGVFTEVCSRLLGSYDYYLNKNHYVWDIAKKTEK